ncbi:hypothetical protein D9758_012509 [Tetrapyrgos nigripes]|uniref:Transmembrane protein n=1 Tax=Tetrapyrgos nigripes TaxID=182062 RepID=A0A8H5G362_9AGAR|nr:hypothetical protein D9758_012509 [Tetrapyrgos nigripes]
MGPQSTRRQRFELAGSSSTVFLYLNYTWWSMLERPQSTAPKAIFIVPAFICFAFICTVTVVVFRVCRNRATVRAFLQANEQARARGDIDIDAEAEAGQFQKHSSESTET